MPSASKAIRILISSPCGVQEEHQKARRVIDDLQRHHTSVKSQPILWEDLALPATSSFQQTIDCVLQQEPIDIAVLIAALFLTAHPAKPTYPESSVTCGKAADRLIPPVAMKPGLERPTTGTPVILWCRSPSPYSKRNPRGPIFWGDYRVSRLFNRRPSDLESAARIAELCRRAEPLLLEQKD